MKSGKIAWQETRTIAIGVAVGVGGMIGIFALLGKLDAAVLLGGIAGGVLAVGNFFALAMITTLVAERAEQQDVQGGAKLIRNSYLLRLFVLGAALFICASSGWFDVVALVLPLLFVRPVITLAELFRKKGE